MYSTYLDEADPGDKVDALDIFCVVGYNFFYKYKR